MVSCHEDHILPQEMHEKIKLKYLFEESITCFKRNIILQNNKSAINNVCSASH